MTALRTCIAFAALVVGTAEAAPVVIGAAEAAPHATSASGFAPAASTLLQLRGVDELKSWFNAYKGHPRLIFLVSPT